MAGGLQLGGFGFELLEGLRDVGGFDALVVGATRGEDAIGHRGDDAVVDELLYPAGVAEVGLLRSERLPDGCLQRVVGLVGEDILVALQQVAGNLHQLFGGVVVEVVAEGEASCQSRVGGEHDIHLLGITRKDDEHVGVGLGEDGEQRVEHTATEVFLIIRIGDKGVGLVDKEHVALGLLEDDLHVLFGLSDVLANEAGAVDGDDLALGEQPQRPVDLAKLAGNGGLTRSGVAREDAVENHGAAGFQSSAASLDEETGLVGHRHHSLFDVLEADHLPQFPHALVEGGGAAGEFEEGDVVFGEQHERTLEHDGHRAAEIAGPDLLDHEALDVGHRPIGEHSLLVALEDGARQTVLHQDVGYHVLQVKLSEEVLYQFEGGVGLLLDIALGQEELPERGVEVEQFVDLLTWTAEPEGQMAVGLAYLFYDPAHDELSVGARQLLQIGQAEHLHVVVAQNLVHRLEGVVASQIEERGAVDGSSAVVECHEALEALEQVLGDVVVAGADEQILAGMHHFELVLLAELVVEHQLTGLEDLSAELRHTRTRGHAHPILILVLHATGEHLLDTAPLTDLGLTASGIHRLVDGDVNPEGGGVLRIVDQQNVTTWNPDFDGIQLHGQRPVAVALDKAALVGVADGIKRLVVDETVEAVLTEIGLGLGMEGDRKGCIPQNVFVVVGPHLDCDGSHIFQEISIMAVGFHHGIGHLVVQVPGEGYVFVGGLIIKVVRGLLDVEIVKIAV